jgi:hypothetical protein
MNIETVLNKTLLHPNSSLIASWNKQNYRDIATFAREYMDARKSLREFNWWSVSVTLLSFIAIAVTVNIIPLPEHPIELVTMCLLPWAFMLAGLQAFAHKARIREAFSGAIVNRFAEDILKLDLALIAVRNMSVSHLFVVDEANCIAFLNEALVEGARKVLNAEGDMSSDGIVAAKTEMHNLTDALKPFWGRFGFDKYYDTAEYLRRAENN